ncbi:MAG TPA: hypothetical protein VII70_06450 [Steroidobacteraceae bacterium]
MLAALAAITAPGVYGAPALAGTLAQLQLQSRAVKNAPRMNFCVALSRTPNCRDALDTALHSAAQIVALRGGAPAQHVSYSPFMGSAAIEPQQSMALKFNTDPQWKKRALTLAHEGLTLLRVPQSGHREFTVGINRHGMLGFALKDTTGE